MLRVLQGIMRSKVVTERADNDKMTNASNKLPVINFDKCPDGCDRCLKVCPTGAISEEGVDPIRCIYCQLCTEVCPNNLIEATMIPIIKADEHGTAELGKSLREKIKEVCQGSLHIRYVDAGACNGCDFEINALTNPIYDIQQYGIDFVASPRHADMLLITGVVTRNLEIALMKTYEACPKPTLVVAVGSCGCGGGIFKDAYAAGGGVDRYIPVDVYVPGCPPTPELIMRGILTAIRRIQ